jgi:hypothetical protein
MLKFFKSAWIVYINGWAVAVESTLDEALAYLTNHYKSDTSPDTDRLYQAIATKQDIEDRGYFESYGWMLTKRPNFWQRLMGSDRP